MRLGIHTSIAGSLERAALRASELGANTFQIFSASPRMWRAREIPPEEIRKLHRLRAEFDLHPLCIHAGYLINLAALDGTVRERSIQAFRGELERAAAIGAEYLVVHPGNCRGRSVEQGIAAFAEGLCEAVSGFRPAGPAVLLENTAGSGCNLGSRFEELYAIRELTRGRTPLAVGYCLDTCHLLAAGFDIATATGLGDAVRSAERLLGLGNIHVIHANDSRAPLGSRIDRHANIGEGHIGRAAFHRILTHPGLRGKPFILETPVETPGDDRRNLDLLKSLAARRRAAVPRPVKRK